MMNRYVDWTRRDEPTSWPGVLLGILPFVMLGPVTVLLAYPWPPPAWRTSSQAAVLISLVYFIVLGVGVVGGWARRWPAWSYPYLGPFFLYVCIWPLTTIDRLSRTDMGTSVWAGPLTIAVCGALVVALLLLGSHHRRLRRIGEGVMHDWTRLSFCLLMMATLTLGGIDHDEAPQLTAYVILPTLVLVAGAAAYLRSRSQALRALALLIALCLAVAISVAGGAWYEGVFGVGLAAIIFAPAWLVNATRRKSAEPM